MKKLLDLKGPGIDPDTYDMTNGLGYVYLGEGDKQITLDADFTAEELQHLLTIMDEPAVTMDSYNTCPFYDQSGDYDHEDKIDHIEINENGAVLHRSCSCGGSWTETAGFWVVQKQERCNPDCARDNEHPNCGGETNPGEECPRFKAI